MKKALFLMGMAAILLASNFAAAADPSDNGTAPKAPTTKKAAFANMTDQLSYAIGVNIGQNINQGIKSGQIQINLDVMCKAMRDVINDKPLAMTPDEMKETFQNLQKEMMAKRAATATKNEAAAKKFLEENGKKEGIKTTASGLQYKVEKEGDGPMPKATDRVKVNYKGTLLDGKEFDSSYKRGQPLVIPVGGVIPGWSEALKMMKVGSKWQLWIPPSIGYGKEGYGPNIPPNSLLVFEVELIGIEPPATQPAPGMMPGGPGVMPGGPRTPRTPAPRTGGK